MPANVEDGLIVEFEAREPLDLALGVVRSKGGRELPIEEITRNGLVLVSGEIGTMSSRKCGSRQVDG